MEKIFLKLLNMSIAASWLALVVIILRPLIKKTPKSIVMFMWALVAIRLVVPVGIESALSLLPSGQTIPENIIYSDLPTINSGVEIIDSVINPIISTSLAPEIGASVNPMQVLASLGSYIWVIGVVIMLLYSIISYWKVAQKVNEAVLIQDNILVCDHIDTPFILGLINPRIYLPSNMNEEDKKYVIAHEIAHLKRGDHLYKPFGFLLLTIYWFNPILWLAYILLCKDIELACDEKVIKEMGKEVKKAYSNALINCSAQHKIISACPLAFGEVDVKGRVKSILNYKKPTTWLIIVALVVCIVLSVGFLTNPHEEIDAKSVPNLKVSNGEMVVDAWRGTYNWTFEGSNGEKKGINVDTAEPIKVLNKIPTIHLLEGSDTVELLFDKNPDYIKVVCYEVEKGENQQGSLVKVNGNSFNAVNGKYMYEIFASWNEQDGESGEVYYAIQVFTSDKQQQAEDNWGISINLEVKDNLEYELLISHDADKQTVNGELKANPEYELRVIYNDCSISFGDYMRNVLNEEYNEADISWQAVLYNINPDGELRMSGDFKTIYGKLPDGVYEFCKPIILTTENNELIKRVYKVQFVVTN